MSSPILDRAQPVVPIPAAVFEGPSPVASVYLRTAGGSTDAADQVALRWKNLRRSLAEDGATDAVLDVVESHLDGAHAAGETLVVVADDGGTRFCTHLPELPDDDVAVVGALPHLVPLLAATQVMLPHLVVATDRIGAEIVAVLPAAPDLHREVSGEDHHIARSAPGGWSQRRFQQRAENRWEANARDVADELTRLADATSPRLVVVSGDVRAVAFLREHLPGRVAELIAEVQGDYGDVDDVLARGRDLVAGQAERDTEEALAALGSSSGRPDDAVVGVDATFEALTQGRAGVVLVHPASLADRVAWFGPEPMQAATSAEELRMAGVDAPEEGPMADVLVRAALGTSAGIRIVSNSAALPGGVGAILRY